MDTTATVKPVQSERLPDQVEEIFLMVDNEDDAKAVNRLMGAGQASIIKQERERHILDNGIVPDLKLPDVAKRLQETILVKQWQRVLETRLAAAEQPEDTVVTRQYHPEQVAANVGRLEIQLDHKGMGFVAIDGNRLQGIAGFQLHCEAGSLPSITLQLHDVPPASAQP